MAGKELRIGKEVNEVVNINVKEKESAKLQVSRSEDKTTTKFVAKPAIENVEQSREDSKIGEGKGKETMKKFDKENTIELKEQQYSKPIQTLVHKESEPWEQTLGKNPSNFLACCTNPTLSVPGMVNYVIIAWSERNGVKHLYPNSGI